MGQRGMIAFVGAIVCSGLASAQTTPVRAAPTTTQSAAVAPQVDIPAEPSRASGAGTPATLREAAEAGDFPSFETLVRKARANGETLGAFADLYEVWTFAQTNATGAYYGAAMHDRMAARYPDYEKFIEDYRITDRHGSPFYPSAETRAFLLRQAVEGNDPVVTAGPAVARPAARRETSSVAALRPASPKPIAAPTAVEPVESLPSDALVNDMGKVIPQPRPAVAEAQMVDASATTRGIFLIILGLIGIGVVTVTMQASASDVHVTEDEEHAERAVTMSAPREAHPSGSQG